MSNLACFVLEMRLVVLFKFSGLLYHKVNDSRRRTMGIDHFEWNQMMGEELCHSLRIGDASWERMQEAQ